LIKIKIKIKIYSSKLHKYKLC